MAIDVRKIRETLIHTRLSLSDDPDDDLEIVYTIGALGSSFATWLNDPDGGMAPNSIYAAIEMTCKSLGITQDGVPIPCTAEALRRADVPPQILHAVLTHIRQEASLGKLRGSSSPRGLQHQES